MFEATYELYKHLVILETSEEAQAIINEDDDTVDDKLLGLYHRNALKLLQPYGRMEHAHNIALDIVEMISGRKDNTGAEG